MNIDIIYHYPPEILSLLVDTIPLLCRSKNDVLLFFKGGGVPATITADLHHKLAAYRGSVNKYEMVRDVLVRLNDKRGTKLTGAAGGFEEGH